MITATGIAFDAERHEYRRADGARVPSVTEILRTVGISVDFEALADTLGAGPAETIADKRTLGQVVHQDAHAFDDGDLVWATVHPAVVPYLEAWATFRANQELEPLVRERIVHHPRLQYAGTLDGIFRRRSNDRRVLVDIKLGDPDDAGGADQTAAYQLAYQAEHPDARIDERLCVWLRPDRTVPYRIHPYPDWRDLQAWPGVVTTYYRGQAARRLRHDVRI